MIDAVNLRLLEDLPDLLIQGLRRGKIAPKRFFDDDAPPAAIALAGQPGRPELLDHLGKDAGGRREEEKVVARRPMLFIDWRQEALQATVRLRVFSIAWEIIDPPGEPLPEFRINRPGGEFPHVLR